MNNKNVTDINQNVIVEKMIYISYLIKQINVINSNFFNNKWWWEKE